MSISVGVGVGVAEDNDEKWLYGEQDEEQGQIQVQVQDKGESHNNTTAAADGDNDKTLDQDKSVEDKQNNDNVNNEDGEGEDDDAHFDDDHFEDNETLETDKQENGDSDSDDSEDDVKVIIGDLKSAAPQSYASLNIKKGGFQVQSIEKQKQAGKFNVEEFESVGTINGVPAQEFNIDVLEDKPWRKPGADLTDYFNYGFNEDTWRAYCERQRRMRIHESGTGLIPLGGNPTIITQQSRNLTPILNDNSKYSVGFGGIRKAGPPPGRKMTGPIDVIGTRRDPEDSPEGGLNKNPMQIPTRENTIQVLTADRREYSRGKPFPDMSLPPPGSVPPPSNEFFHGQEPSYYPPPFPDDRWGPGGGWAPNDIKELTPSSMAPMSGPPPRMRSRSRSRSRSRRHRSRSRSPSSHRHRSKKKSHRKDKDDTD